MFDKTKKYVTYSFFTLKSDNPTKSKLGGLKRCLCASLCVYLDIFIYIY